MIYKSKLSKQQVDALLSLKEKLSFNDEQLDYLIACMMFESNLNPQAINKISKAVGLIQFMPSTLKSLGFDYNTVYNMSFIQQLDLVYLYFKPYCKKTKTLEDMYMAILYPSFIGKPNDKPLFVKGTIQYNQNCALDRSNKGVITKQDACYYVKQRYNKGLLDV